MNTNRRNFIKSGVLAASALGIGSMTDVLASGVDITNRQSVPLRLSFQESTAPGENLNEKFDYMEKLGIEGFEPHGNNRAGHLSERINEIQQALRGRNIKVNVICAGFQGWLIAEDEAERRRCIETTKELMTAGAELGSTGMILVPEFNRQKPSLPMPQSREVLIEHLKEIGEFA